jgi:hypothetical protein
MATQTAETPAYDANDHIRDYMHKCNNAASKAAMKGDKESVKSQGLSHD